MSRNFELLRSTGQADEIFQMLPHATVPAMQPAGERAPQLEAGGAERDQLGKLVQRLFLSQGGDAARTVGFIAPERGNGCSWLCAHASEMLATVVPGGVCLVDASLHAPALHGTFRTKNPEGLADALVNSNPIEDYLCPLARPNLWLLTAGSVPGNWEELLVSDRMQVRLAELRAQFDFVLVDAPSLSTTNAALVLGAACDGVVLVLKANSSRRDVARKAVEEIKANNVRILGAVLNQRTFVIPESIYRRL